MWRGSFKRPKCLVKTINQEIDVGLRDAHGWFDPQDVALNSAPADQQPAIFGTFMHRCRCMRGGLFAETVLHQLDTEQQPAIAHVSDEMMGSLQIDQRLLQTAADFGCASLDVFKGAALPNWQSRLVDNAERPDLAKQWL